MTKQEKEYRFYAGVFLFIAIVVAYTYIASAFDKYTIIASIIFAILLIVFIISLVKFLAFRRFVKKGLIESSKLLLGLFTPDESRAKKPPRKYIPEPTRQLVIDRAGEACQICGVRENCDIHHIDGHRDNPNPNNLMFLCKNCHSMAKNYRREQLIRWRDRRYINGKDSRSG